MSDPFTILGLPRSFRVSAGEVTAAYMRACARLHPDRARNPVERDELMRRAAEAGQARQQLMSELGRAEALLAVVAPAGASAQPDAPLPAAFLMGAMEMRERIEESATDDGARADIVAEVSRLRAGVIEELAAACAALGEPGDAAAFAAAKGALARLRYIERMRAHLHEQPEG